MISIYLYTYTPIEIKMPTLIARNISININQHTLMNQLSFSVAPGKVLNIMGPSGCGKSTLLNYLSGTLTDNFITEGSVHLGEKNIDLLPTEQRNVGILYQSPLLFPHMTNVENLMFAIPKEIKGKQRKELALIELNKFNLVDKAEGFPKNLSGGQQARISLLRTLLSKPAYMLLDEPFSKLDTHLRREVREFVLQQIQDAELPTILVTHDNEDAKSMGGEVLTLSL